MRGCFGWNRGFMSSGAHSFLPFNSSVDFEGFGIKAK